MRPRKDMSKVRNGMPRWYLKEYLRWLINLKNRSANSIIFAWERVNGIDSEITRVKKALASRWEQGKKPGLNSKTRRAPHKKTRQEWKKDIF